MDIIINGKTYKNVQEYTITKLFHILQLSVDAVNNYKKQTKQVQEYLKYLENIVSQIEDLIEQKMNKLKEK